MAAELRPGSGTDHETGAEFDILLSVLDTKTGVSTIPPRSRSSRLTASTDITNSRLTRGRPGSPCPNSGGERHALFRARVKAEGSVEINASADDAEPATVTLNVTKAKDKKKIEIQFHEPRREGNKDTHTGA